MEVSGQRITLVILSSGKRGFVGPTVGVKVTRKLAFDISVNPNTKKVINMKGNGVPVTGRGGP
jgi:hypothetical protein